MVIGTVLRSHAGGYVVYQDELETDFQCAARGRLKKENLAIHTGDSVELDEINQESNTAVISSLKKRENLLSRPRIANVDQIVIVQAIHQPEWNSLWCDRHLVHFQLEVPNASILLCFNKCDLVSGDESQSLTNTYGPLGYDVLVASARTGFGIDQLKAKLAGKISVFAGPSGVGKSSILNAIEPSLNLKIGVMENEFGVGRHTTTASEIYRLRLGGVHATTWVADTPGFSLPELQHPKPADLASMFPEMIELAKRCHFSDCLHLVEKGCYVIEQIATISAARYESYKLLVEESFAEQKSRKSLSTKVESSVKQMDGKAGSAKDIPRLKSRYRTPARNTEKQKLMTTKLKERQSLASSGNDSE